MTENEVYEFYNDSVKVIYSEIEALNNSLPIELLFEIIGATVLFIFCKLLSLPFRKKSGKKKKSFSENVRAKPQSDTKTAAEPPAPKVKITSAYKIDWSKPPVSVRKINWDDGVKSVEKIDWSKVDRK